MNSPQPAPQQDPLGQNLTMGRFGSAPQWAANIVIVFAFLAYMHMQDIREDKVSEQRIKSCREIQDRSVDVMEKLAAALAEYQHDCRNMNESFDRLERALQDQTRALEELRRAMGERRYGGDK